MNDINKKQLIWARVYNELDSRLPKHYVTKTGSRVATLKTLKKSAYDIKVI